MKNGHIIVVSSFTVSKRFRFSRKKSMIVYMAYFLQNIYSRSVRLGLMETSEHWLPQGEGQRGAVWGRGRLSSLEQWHSKKAGSEMTGKRTLDTGKGGAGGEKRESSRM